MNTTTTDTVFLCPERQHEAAWWAFTDALAAIDERYYVHEVDRRRGGFAAYIEALERIKNGTRLPRGFCPFERWWLMTPDQREIIGVGSIRLRDTREVINLLGHVGYTVAPAYRGKGYGKALCRELLTRCWALGMHRSLITCDEENHASARIIESCGGVFEDARWDILNRKRKRRYWVTDPSAPVQSAAE